ncbi:MAG: TonB-dependent receptor [Saprospiraceae bacterium]|nr:TonB-dependent receptor [Candidatus Opimibacter iunctus]
MSKFTLGILAVLWQVAALSAQDDTLKAVDLEHIVVKGYRFNEVTAKLSDVHGTYIIGGRKSTVLPVQDLPANLAEKTGRQIFAKIPGAFIYDMDGSGNQVNFSTRGLDAHRSWEYNVRQNGVLLNSDIYGYPASHYSMPMEAVKNIEIVQGTAALQYGAEFGGMINYVTKSADTTKPVSFESINTVGSYGLFSSYNALGGKLGKFSYYTYYQRRVSDGYRTNARSDAQAQFANLKYDFSSSLNLQFEIGRSEYVYQIPGPLTDSMFYADPRQATRSRNYFNPDIYVPSMTLNWQVSPATSVQWIVSGLFGARNSVEFEGFADKQDVIDPVTLQYKPRAVNIDNFNSKTSELRILHQYGLGKMKSVVSAALRYFNNDMHRRQQGKGTTGTDYDLTITGDWGRDLYYKSNSISVSVENMLYINSRWSVSPGFRYEVGGTDMTGYIAYLDEGEVPNHIDHNIPAFGINTKYVINEGTQVYAGISQAYRPVLFKDIIPTSSLERADKDLEDAFGYNAEAGISGHTSDWLKYEVTLFHMVYRNKLGNTVQTEDGVDYIYKTNIGDSETNGIELFAEAIPVQEKSIYVSLYTATSLMKAVYTDAAIAVNGENTDISGNEVESVPRWISRNGLNIGYKELRATLQYSYVAKSFSDPSNVIDPTPNGAKGIVPSYGLLDLNFSCRFAGHFVARAGINNLLNHQYFTKRPLFYPGPGVWSSDGRSIVVSLGVKF